MPVAGEKSDGRLVLVPLRGIFSFPLGEKKYNSFIFDILKFYDNVSNRGVSYLSCFALFCELFSNRRLFIFYLL